MPAGPVGLFAMRIAVTLDEDHSREHHRSRSCARAADSMAPQMSGWKMRPARAAPQETQQRKTRARLEAFRSRGDLLWRQTAAIGAKAGVKRIGIDTVAVVMQMSITRTNNLFIVGPGGKTGVTFHCKRNPRPPTATFRRGFSSKHGGGLP